MKATYKCSTCGGKLKKTLAKITSSRVKPPYLDLGPTVKNWAVVQTKCQIDLFERKRIRAWVIWHERLTLWRMRTSRSGALRCVTFVQSQLRIQEECDLIMQTHLLGVIPLVCVNKHSFLLNSHCYSHVSLTDSPKCLENRKTGDFSRDCEKSGARIFGGFVALVKVRKRKPKIDSSINLHTFNWSVLSLYIVLQYVFSNCAWKR